MPRVRIVCRPAPYVAGRAGDGTVDRHGDNLVTASACGDHEARYRHDPLVEQLTTAARNAGCYARQEDSSFYRSAIPNKRACRP